MCNGDDEKAVGRVGNTSQGVVPGEECGEHAKGTTSTDTASVRFASDWIEVADTEEKEGEVQREEQQEKGDGGLEGAEEEDGGEDEPALFSGQPCASGNSMWCLPSGRDRKSRRNQ